MDIRRKEKLIKMCNKALKIKERGKDKHLELSDEKIARYINEFFPSLVGKTDYNEIISELKEN